MRSLTGLREWVALDLETTGLSSDTDDIIEIGAVKFASRQALVDEFHSLVNPRRRLSNFHQGAYRNNPVGGGFGSIVFTGIDGYNGVSQGIDA